MVGQEKGDSVTYTEQLKRTESQLAGVRRKLQTVSDPHLQTPYKQQIGGLIKKKEKLEMLLSVHDTEGVQILE